MLCSRVSPIFCIMVFIIQNKESIKDIPQTKNVKRYVF